MKKIIIKLFAVAVVFVMSAPLVSASNLYTPNFGLNKIGQQPMLIDGVFKSKEFNENWAEYLSDKYGENYLELFARNSQSVKNAQKIESLFPSDRYGKRIYPDFVGGLYINDKDYLVTQIVEGTVPNEKASEYSVYTNALAIDKDATIEYVKYSYAELETVNDRITDYYLKNYPEGNISAFYIDIVNNRVVVELNIYSEEEITKFKNVVIDSPLIAFEKGVEDTDYANLNPGGLISPLSCSYGYRARYGGTNGIVSAGHCVSGGVGTSISGIGTVQRWQVSGQVDAAWIQTLSSNTPTNTLAWSSPYGSTGPTLTTVITFFVVGERVGKVGYASQWTDGTITNISYGSGGLSGLINTNVWAQPGDSGGLVFENPTAGLLGYQTAGIVRGGPVGGGNMHFVRADRINSALAIGRY